MQISLTHSKTSLYPIAIELGTVWLILCAAFVLRFYAALHTGIEVDEPIYRYAAAYAAQYGFPASRPAVGQPTIPFLYHPPFSLWLFALWFRIWGSTSFLTGRLFNIVVSTGMLALLYAFVRRFIGKREALIALFVVASDDWILFTNQGIYLEDSQMILILCAMWAYWKATQSDPTKGRQVLLRYLLAGVLVGVVIDYKQIGGFLVVGILINFALQRQQWRPHLLLLVAASTMFILYLVAMHLTFGQLFDSATLTQLNRTAGTRSSAGLTYSPLTAIQAIVGIYWIFPTTILTLIGGSLLVIWRGFQYLRGKRKGENTVLLSWAAGGIVFAMSISLKSPHYMILWLIPLYLFLVQEGSHIHTYVFRCGKNSALIFLTLLQIIFGVNLWSFQMRFMNIPGDVVVQSDTYINTHIPSSALVAEQ